jgi:DNA-directed RNA polymerase specialized sigma24 family protein
MKMGSDDLEQELALILWKNINRFNSAYGVKPSTFYAKILQYSVLNLYRMNQSDKRCANFNTTEFIYKNDDGDEVEYDFNFAYDDETLPHVSSFLKTLTDEERTVLVRKMNKKPIGRQNERHMINIRTKAVHFFGYSA